MQLERHDEDFPLLTTSRQNPGLYLLALSAWPSGRQRASFSPYGYVHYLRVTGIHRNFCWMRETEKTGSWNEEVRTCVY